jgi:peptide methionine sulfoxide reductase msrA/msrB
MKDMKEIYLAGGCFWGLEKYFAAIPGVLKTRVGYANGKTVNPSYEEVCSGRTGHAETVRIEYDPRLIPLTKLLDLYYNVINPTSVNRQGPDVGTQYRTGIFWTDDEDERIILGSVQLLSESYDKPLALEVEKLESFYDAEDYHQNYLEKNSRGYCHIGPSKFEEAKQILNGKKNEATATS